ncbi:MAG: hypothetical protein WCS86_01770 [Candidatus Paceibacterota bacterium]
MLGENKNLKDSPKGSIRDTVSRSLTSYDIDTPNMYSPLPYTKINKLITALYMVTDTMEKDEPIRLKLRTLGVEILSDTASGQRGNLNGLNEKIVSILSFLSISFDIRMISEMNSNILRKEFEELKLSIQEFTSRNNLWLEGFLETPQVSLSDKEKDFSKGHNPSLYKGQSTRIGVQKGSTLMNALNKVEHGSALRSFSEDRGLIKKGRRDSIIKVLGQKPDGMSIRDIAVALQGVNEEVGEKTLQRELVSMVKDNVLKKTGEKRWSQYFLNQKNH